MSQLNDLDERLLRLETSELETQLTLDQVRHLVHTVDRRYVFSGFLCCVGVMVVGFVGLFTLYGLRYRCVVDGAVLERVDFE